MDNQTHPDDYLLTRSEVSERFGISKRYLETTGNHSGPPAIRLGRRTIRYRPNDVRAWLEGRRIDPEETAG